MSDWKKIIRGRRERRREVLETASTGWQERSRGVLFWLLLQRPLGKWGLPDSAARAINHHNSTPPPCRDLEATRESHSFSNTKHTHTHTREEVVCEPGCHFCSLSHTAAASGPCSYSHSPGHSLQPHQH